MTKVHLTPEQAARYGFIKPARKSRTTRKVARGRYHTRCVCGQEFTTQAAEDRHVTAGHNRYVVVTKDTSDG